MTKIGMTVGKGPVGGAFRKSKGGNWERQDQETLYTLRNCQRITKSCLKLDF